MQVKDPVNCTKTRLVVQGQHEVSSEREMVFSTLLGSCVATCMCDPIAGIGGMNHFLLAGGSGAQVDSERYGIYAMEILINSLLKGGAKKTRIQSKVFGGATMAGKMGQIGEENCRFAVSYLETERISIVSSSLGGHQARRIRFWPATGQAQVMFVQEDSIPIQKSVLPSVPLGDVTFF